MVKELATGTRALGPEAGGGDGRARASHVRDLISLTKPGITALVVVTTAAGAYLGAQGALDPLLLLHVLVGTALLAGGTNALNQYAERALDGRMARTRDRPLPSGRITSRAALWFALSISAAGALHLGIAVNGLTAMLGIAALAIYILVYTPMKTRTSLCTLVGAVPGAIPPLMGWAAVRNGLGAEAWVLFGILFLWQLPHFLAIAWLYRDDYEAAGFPMLPVVDASGTSTGRQVLLYTAALVPVSLLTSVLGLTGALYFFGALTLGIAFLLLGLGLAVRRSPGAARRLFFASVLYLPALLALMAVDKI